MSTSASAPQERRASAAAALSALGVRRSDAQVLSVQCRDGHHVAAVYRTDAGMVVATRTGPHGHGSRDFIDTGHRGARGGQDYVDLVEVGPSVGDDVPAWCDCGVWTLSRAEIIDHLGSGQRTVHLP